MGLREDESANSASGRWTRALADLPLTERSTPRLAPPSTKRFSASDLVNVNVPYEPDYKHHYSRWETYRITDFYPPPVIEERVASFARFVPAVGTLLLALTDIFSAFVPPPFDILVRVLIAILGFGVSAYLELRHAERSDDEKRGRAALGKTNRRIRQIWLGFGQVQFGCGPKGLSVEQQGGFLYLLKWRKVDFIYEAEDPTGDRFRVGDIARQLPAHTSEFSAATIANCGGSGVLNNDEKREIRVRLEVMKKKPDAWARKSVRLRLHRGKGAILVDELIIPKRWFGAGRGDDTWDTFFEHCWHYKIESERSDSHSATSVAIVPHSAAH